MHSCLMTVTERDKEIGVGGRRAEGEKEELEERREI